MSRILELFNLPEIADIPAQATLGEFRVIKQVGQGRVEGFDRLTGDETGLRKPKYRSAAQHVQEKEHRNGKNGETESSTAVCWYFLGTFG